MGFKAAVPVWSKKYNDEWNIMLSFTSEIRKEDGKYEFKAAADNFYRLLINDKFVLFGPERCAKGSWRVDEIDITEHLSDGMNNIRIDVIHYGVGSFYYVNQKGKAFLQAELLHDGTPVCYTAENGGGFTCRRCLSKEQKVERFSFQRPFLESYTLPLRYSEALELRKTEGIKLLDRGVLYPLMKSAFPVKEVGTGDFKIKPGVSIKPYDRRIVNKMSDYCYDVSEFETLYSEKRASFELSEIKETGVELTHEYEFSLSGGKWTLFSLESELTGFVALDICAKEDSEIYITFDEVLYGGIVDVRGRNDSCTSLIRLKAEKGRHRFLSFEPLSMKYFQVFCLEGDVTISDFHLVRLENPDVYRACFDSSDESLNRVFRAAVATYVQNSVDLYTDCPSRERAGYLCDSFFTSRTERDLSGKSIIEHDFIENFIIAENFTIPKGMLPMCYPSDALDDCFIPNWTMFFFIQLEEYFSRTGDRKLVDAAKTIAYDMIDYFKRFENSDGLLQDLENWIFIEWSQANEWVYSVNFPTNMLFYRTLRTVAELYDDASLTEKAERLKESIRRLSYNGMFFEDNLEKNEDGKLERKGHISEVCQYYAFFSGVADAETYPDLLNRIINDFGPGHKCQTVYSNVFPANAFIGNFLRMEILSEAGRQEQLISEIIEYFDFMAKITGTLWENDGSYTSCNHGFASHLVRIFYRDILGIAKVDDIERKIYASKNYFAPEKVTAKLPVAEGEVEISISGGNREITVPSGYTLINI